MNNYDSHGNNVNWSILFVCWLIASVSTLGALFLSEVIEISPCILCWYQRIAIFPLVIIIIPALFPFSSNVIRYVLPLTVIGWIFALYHNLIYYGFIPERLQPCSKGVSCADINLNIFGFITIPLLSLAAFTTIITLLIFLKRRL